MLSYGCFEHLQAGCCFQCVGQALAYNKAAIHIYDGRQVHNAFLHRHISDANGPRPARYAPLSGCAAEMDRYTAAGQLGQMFSGINGSDVCQLDIPLYSG